MFPLNCFSMAAIVRAAVFMPLMTIGRSGGFCDWKWMKPIQICVCMRDVFCEGERILFTCVLSRIVLSFFFFFPFHLSMNF